MNSLIDDIRSRHTGMTKGKWSCQNIGGSMSRILGWVTDQFERVHQVTLADIRGVDTGDTASSNAQREANAQFIAHAPADISFLLEERERFVEFLREVRNNHSFGCAFFTTGLEVTDERCELCKQIDALLLGDSATGKAGR